MWFGTYFDMFEFVYTKLYNKEFQLLSVEEVKITLPKIVGTKHVVFYLCLANV